MSAIGDDYSIALSADRSVYLIIAISKKKSVFENYKKPKTGGLQNLLIDARNRLGQDPNEPTENDRKDTLQEEL